MSKWLSWTAIGIVIAIGLWAAGSWYLVAGIEEARYTVLERRNGYELRAYRPAVVAETDMPTLDTQARSEAFRAIAGYIFGRNEGQRTVAMTTPVTMTAQPTKIAMTAPVLMGAGTMAFVMPAQFTSAASMPKPLDARVRLRDIPARKMAALQFGWYATADRVAAKTTELQVLLARDGAEPKSPPSLASYNPPFSMPLLFRHDILIEVR